MFQGSPSVTEERRLLLLLEVFFVSSGGPVEPVIGHLNEQKL